MGIRYQKFFFFFAAGASLWEKWGKGEQGEEENVFFFIFLQEKFARLIKLG